MANTLRKLGSKQWRSLYSSYRKHLNRERRFLKDRGLPFKEGGKRVLSFDKFKARYNQYRGDKARGEWVGANITRSMAFDQLRYNSYEQAKVLYRYEKERGGLSRLYEITGETNRSKILTYLTTNKEELEAFRGHLSDIYQADKRSSGLFDENGRVKIGKEAEADMWLKEEARYIREEVVGSP